MDAACRTALTDAKRDVDFVRLDATAFRSARNESIDYAVIEKTTEIAVVKGRFRWSDVGAWDAIWQVSEHDGEGNAIHGDGVILASHDGDFVPQVDALLQMGRRVGVLCFREFLSAQLAELDGIEIYDLESDVEAFNAALPRVRIIPLGSFDPSRYL